jgi:RHS repeat-associated protein
VIRRSFFVFCGLLACAIAQAVPVVSLTTPAANSKFVPPASIVIAATATDTADTIARVDFYDGATLIGTSAAAPYSYTWTGVPVGSHVLSAKAVTSRGVVKASSARTITVNTPPTVAIASPAANASFVGNASFAITASPADADGAISKVEFYRNGALFGTATAPPYTANLVNLIPGKYSLTAKVTDSMGSAVTSSAVAVTVTHPVSVAISSPAANSKFVPAAPIPLSVTASDSNTTATISKVEYFDGTALIGTVTSSPFSMAWTTATTGLHSITAVATDSQGLTKTSAAVKVTVNAPPTVALTSPTAGASIFGGTAVSIAATANDADGTIAKVQFYRGSTLIGTATAEPYTATWLNATPGVHSLTARATDNLGSLVSSTPVSVTVANPLQVAISAPVSNSKYLPGTPITLTSTASNGNPASTIAKVDFFSGSNLIGTATSAPYTVSWANAAAAIHAITAVVSDSLGQSKTSSAIKVTVDAPPTVALTAPLTGSSYVGLATIALAADVADSDGTVAKVQFYRGGTLIATTTSAPYTANWTNAAPGTYSITARVTDNLGIVTISAPVTVTVTNPVTVSMATPLNNARFIPPATIDLTANATTSNGTIARVDFYNDATLIGSVTTPPFTVPWSNVGTGKYRITAKATDNQGISKTSGAITVIADTSPDVAIAAPLNNTAYAVGSNVTIDANVSDPDGSITKVQFFRGSTVLATLTAPPFTTTWSNAAKGTFTLTAKATDNLGVTTTSMPVVIKVGSNTAPSVGIETSASSGLIAPATVMLQAAASDVDGSVAEVEYYNGDALIGRSTTAPFFLEWGNIAAGNYTITAKAIDNLGASSRSASRAMIVASNNAPLVALTSPVPGQPLIGPLNITLTATASDADGSVTKVEFLDGDTVLATLNAAPFSYVLANAIPGTYQFSVRATDNHGISTTSASTEITVTANGAPVVGVTATPNVATAPALIVLGANATDADGTIAQVEYFNGEVSLGKVMQAPFSMNWSNVAAGTYSIRAAATDNNGAVSSSSAIAVTVNTPPTVAIAAPLADRVFAAPATVAALANASAASGAAIATVDFHNGSTLLGTASEPPFGISLAALPAGSYTLTAVATDTVGASATSAPVAFTVVDNNAPSISLTATPIVPGVPATVVLNAAASDSDGSVAKVEFYSGQQLLASLTQPPFAHTVSNIAAGAYSFTAVAVDNLGTSTTSSPVAVSINALPTVGMLSPAANAVFSAPAKVVLSASAIPDAASGATIAQVSFYSSGTLVGTVTASPYTLEVQNVAAGMYEVTAVATDSLGGVATSSKLPFSVVVNAAPVVSLVATPSAATAPATVLLTANASDSDGTISKVEFFNGSTLLATSTQAPYQFSWQNVAMGNYSLTAKATDSLNGTTTSTPVSVTISGVGSKVYYVHADQINSARLITDQAGVAVWQADTDPFGANLPNENVSGQGTFTYNPRFPGQYFDKETGLHYNYFRDYDPSLGRYVQSDPIGLEGGINTFAYVEGNPISFSDPLGLERITSQDKWQPPAGSKNEECRPDEKCKNTITIHTGGVCPPGDAMCPQAMKAAGMAPPYEQTSITLDLNCLAKFGIGAKGGAAGAGYVAGKHLPGILANGASKVGMPAAGAYIGAGGTAIAEISSGPLGITASIMGAIGYLAEKCKCKGAK